MQTLTQVITQTITQVFTQTIIQVITQTLTQVITQTLKQYDSTQISNTNYQKTNTKTHRLFIPFHKQFRA